MRCPPRAARAPGESACPSPRNPQARQPPERCRLRCLPTKSDADVHDARHRGWPRGRMFTPMQRRDPEGVETAAIADLVELNGRRVLEVGCGGGRLTTFAAARAASVYAFDPDAGNVETAASAVPADVRDRVRFA